MHPVLVMQGPACESSPCFLCIVLHLIKYLSAQHFFVLIVSQITSVLEEFNPIVVMILEE